MAKKDVLKAIREKCIDCCAGNQAEVRNCEIETCSLLPYRMGKDPNTTRVLSEEHLAKLRKGLKKRKKTNVRRSKKQ